MIYCGVEQWSARKPHKLQVAGSSPAPATNFTPGWASAREDLRTYFWANQ